MAYTSSRTSPTELTSQEDLFHEDTTPKTLQHTFLDPVLRAHFAKTPMPPGSAALIDLPPDVILDTEEEIHVIAACLWIMSIRYDGLTQSERPKKPEDLRKVSDKIYLRAPSA